MWNRKAGHNNSIAGKALVRAALAGIVTLFFTPWLIVEVFVLTTLHFPCPPAPTLPAGFEPVLIPLKDGYTLRGWWRPPDDGAVILFMGGMGSGRSAMLEEARWLAEDGFGALLIESRSCAGGSITLGYRESADFMAMMDFARSRAEVNRFGAFGFSTGAAAAARAAAASTDIRAVALEGGFADLADLLAPRRGHSSPAESLLQKTVLAVFWQNLHYWPGLVSPVRDLTKIAPRPVLLIYGDREPNRVVAEEMLLAGGKNAELWIAAGADHGGYTSAGGDFRKVLLDFFTRALKNASG